MQFTAPPEHYDRFMGRYLPTLATELAGAAGVAPGMSVVDGSVTAHADYSGFEDFWEPFGLSVGPAGEFLASLPEQQRTQVRNACRDELPSGSFTLEARAWYARGVIGS